MDFAVELLHWYENTKRDLPWRNTRDPYRIWLSEIILQQTRVEQGLPYYLRFVEKFPSVKELGTAKEDEVLKLWQGLGYYTRARNLCQTANVICKKYGGRFPSAYAEILALKGIGKYTAAAIASFAFNQPYPAIDGNVQRVLSRIFGIREPANSPAAEKKFYAIAEKLIDRKKPGLFNQAMMEFGAIHCTPVNPKCNLCFFQQSCIAFNMGLQQELPVKKKKIPSVERHFNYLIIRRGKTFFIQQRAADDIWKNLYEFPLIETEGSYETEAVVALPEWKNFWGVTNYKIEKISPCYRHILSHQTIYARFWEISLPEKKALPKTFKKYTETDLISLQKYPVSRLTEKYISSTGF